MACHASEQVHPTARPRVEGHTERDVLHEDGILEQGVTALHVQGCRSAANPEELARTARRVTVALLGSSSIGDPWRGHVWVPCEAVRAGGG